MKRIVITGALGHIGSRFIHSIRPGMFAEVILLDNLSTQRYASLFNLPEDVPFRFVEADVCRAKLEEHTAGVDAVIHMAAITNAAESFKIQEEVERVNFEGTQRVAEACLKSRCKLIFPSTTSVYGTQEEVVDEHCTVDELKPQSPYAESKLKAERLLQTLGRSSGLPFAICRFGTIYGTSAGMRFHTAINKFCWQACVGQPITVWRTALHQKRPYLDLGDAVRALHFILDTDRFDGEVYNVLTENLTVQQIVDVLRKYVPGLHVEFVDSQIMNQLSYTVACEKFKALGFRFKGSLEEGIRKTVQTLSGVMRGETATR
jgi:nucleoside-diphosphate-sugar epimerase